MAQLSPSRFSVEEFPEQASWISKLFSSLNAFTGDVVRSYQNSLTIGDNLFQEIKEIAYRNSSSSFPLKFRTKFNSSPIGIVPIYLLNRTTGSYSTAQPWVVWSYQDGSVVISDISGLTASSDYTIKLLIVYG